MTSEPRLSLQSLPKVDRVIEDPRVKLLLERHGRTLVVDELRRYLDRLRHTLLEQPATDCPPYDALVEDFVREAEYTLLPTLRRCVNAAGIVLHTALGRAPFAEEAQTALQEAVLGYSTLQVNLESGKRGDRHAHVEELLKYLTGAESAIVVNNNAAATLLILNTLAEGREVVISRGELVEIGGSFRIPDVLRRSGASLVEVGTTNRTHLRDYAGAITERTGVLMKVHQSNYRIIGFTSEVPIGELATLAHERNLVAVDDVGSGAIVDLSRWHLPKEPVVRESVAAGADLVCFSGDKLIGGPQCGIVVGKKDLIDRLKRNQLTRALRCDKMTYAVLAATLRLFLDEDTLLARHRVLRMLTMPEGEIEARARQLSGKLEPMLTAHGTLAVERDTSEAGSGSLAGFALRTWVVRVIIHGVTAETVGRRLRQEEVPVIARISDDAITLDCRTISDGEIPCIVKAVASILRTM